MPVVLSISSSSVLILTSSFLVLSLRPGKCSGRWRLNVGKWREVSDRSEVERGFRGPSSELSGSALTWWEDLCSDGVGVFKMEERIR